MATVQINKDVEPPFGSATTLNGVAEAIDQPVVVNGTRSGILRFCGQTELGPGLWCGVELSDGQGECDGCVNQVRYFNCPPNHGIIVRAHNVAPARDVHARRSVSTSGALSVESAPHIQDCLAESQAIATASSGSCNGQGQKQSCPSSPSPKTLPSAVPDRPAQTRGNKGKGQDVAGTMPKTTSKKVFRRFGTAIQKAFSGKKQKHITLTPTERVPPSSNGPVPLERSATVPESRMPVEANANISTKQDAVQPMQPVQLVSSSESQLDTIKAAHAHAQAVHETEELRAQSQQAMEKLVMLQSQTEVALGQLRRESTAKIEALEQCRGLLERSVASKAGDIEALQRKIKEEKSMGQSKETEMRVLEEKITASQLLLQKKDAEIKALQREITEVKAIQASRDTVTRLQPGSVTENQSIVDSKEIEIRNLQSQLVSLKTALESGGNAATSYLKAEIDSLKAVYELKQKECREWRGKAERLGGVDATNQQLANQVNVLSARVEQMQFALDERKDAEQEAWMQARQALERLETVVEEGKQLSLQNEMLHYQLGEYGAGIAERPLVGYTRTNAV